MLRALLTFIVLAAVLLLVLGLLGTVGPYEAALIIVVALIAAGLSGWVARKHTA
jgi:hypothetical protein